MTQLAFFAALGEHVQAVWQRAHFDEAEFHEVAGRALNDLRPWEQVTPRQIIDWVLQTPQLPVQFNANSAFGNPPVQVYTAERFFIEALFWADGTTAVHDHGFSGAFCVLSGSSLHSLYDFSCERRMSNDLELGTLAWKKSELLERGAVRPIIHGRKMIHALFHLDQPSVSLVVRTFREPGLQHDYLAPGIGYASQRNFPHALVQQRCLTLLHRTDQGAFREAARKFFASTDHATAFFTLLDFTNMGMPDDALFECLDGVSDAPFSALLRQAFERYRRMLEVTHWRAHVADADHRFLLALLLNLPNRETILQAMQQRYPGANAAKQICFWLRQLSSGATNVLRGLGFSDLLALESELLSVPCETLSPDSFQQHRRNLQTIRALQPLLA